MHGSLAGVIADCMVARAPREEVDTWQAVWHVAPICAAPVRSGYTKSPGQQGLQTAHACCKTLGTEAAAI